MSPSRYVAALILLILFFPASAELFGQDKSQVAEPPPCTRTSKSYPEPVCLADLAHVYMDQHDYEKAETILKRELQVRQKSTGPDNPDVVRTLDRLALLYQKENRFPEAEVLFRRALAIREKAFGVNNVDVAESTEALADFYHAQKNDTEAEELLKKALSIEQKALRPNDPAYPTISWTLTDLGRLYESERRYSEAEPEFVRALTIYQNVPSPNYFNIGDSQFEVAIVFALEDKDAEAESYFKQTLATMEKTLGPDHPRLAPVFEEYSALLQRMNRTNEAGLMKSRANEIRAQAKQKSPVQ